MEYQHSAIERASLTPLQQSAQGSAGTWRWSRPRCVNAGTFLFTKCIKSQTKKLPFFESFVLAIHTCGITVASHKCHTVVTRIWRNLQGSYLDANPGSETSCDSHKKKHWKKVWFWQLLSGRDVLSTLAILVWGSLMSSALRSWLPPSCIPSSYLSWEIGSLCCFLPRQALLTSRNC